MGTDAASLADPQKELCANLEYKQMPRCTLPARVPQLLAGNERSDLGTLAVFATATSSD